jgi:hypothetical protein
MICNYSIGRLLKNPAEPSSQSKSPVARRANSCFVSASMVFNSRRIAGKTPWLKNLAAKTVLRAF